MNTDWSDIADCLRAEIAEYGGLLNCFAEQQRLLLARDPAGVLRLSADIDGQVRQLQACRERRERTVAAFAAAHDRPAAATLRSLLPLFGRDVQPLLEALIKEINVLIHRVRRLNRHNHALLSRAVSAHRETLRALRPEAFGQTYSVAGRLAGPAHAVALQTAV